MTSTVEYFDGAAGLDGEYSAVGAVRPHFRRTLGILAVALAASTGAVTIWDKVATKESVYACPPECGRPPSSLPVGSLTRFVAPDGSFSVGYPPADKPDAEGSVFRITTQENGVTALKVSGDRGELRLFGEPARGRVARQVVNDMLARDFSGADVAFTIPNATVGYQLGYAVVANIQRPGQLSVSRAILMAAVKNDLALVATAEGPFRRFTPEFGPGLPSAANVEIAMDMSKYVDSFSWQGDPPR